MLSAEADMSKFGINCYSKCEIIRVGLSLRREEDSGTFLLGNKHSGIEIKVGRLLS